MSHEATLPEPRANKRRIHPGAIIFGVFGLLVGLQLLFLFIAASQPSDLLPRATEQASR